MASSPKSSSSSSYSSPFAAAPSSFSHLPVVAMRNKIVDKILENRVTLIVGETGCGKSSQIPQFLLEENMEPILCTQPRRFAVVAVARMVARARNCEVGGEVGYHIGHSRVFSSGSKIVFKTAGVLLDEMREKGLNALKYKVIVLDEVHERSVESDLVLVCVKQFLLKNNDLRVVLMSATADISRYREYFMDLGRDERVEVLAIPSTGKNTIFQRKVLYLEQVSELLGMNSDNLSLKYCSGPSPTMAEADFTLDVHKLIHDLVLHIHKNEPDIEKSILVFLPTYVALELQWLLLKPFSHTFKVHILHRSIDTDQALKAMKIWKSHRKVILATNIAESSVTIPQVGYVIDSCLSLQVFWNNNRKTDAAELVWVSKSQADQRKGRTGRTCDGHVYRLVTGSFYGKLEDYESPALLQLSLQQQLFYRGDGASVVERGGYRRVRLLVLIDGGGWMKSRGGAAAAVERWWPEPNLESNPPQPTASPPCIGGRFSNLQVCRFAALKVEPSTFNPSTAGAEFGVESTTVDGFSALRRMAKAMDPPDPTVVGDALDLLVHMRALEKASSRGRHEPTFYGRLLASFSLSFDASVLILKFGDIGMLREGILFGILMDQRPLPILHPFGQDDQFIEFTDSYYRGNSKDTGLGKKEMFYVANFCAFQFWQRCFKDKCRLERLKNIFKHDETEDTKALLPEVEEEWCSFHNLVLPALLQVAETYDEILNSLHRFRPKNLVMSNSVPLHYDPYEFQHTCHLMCVQNKDTDALAMEDEDLEQDYESRKCIAVPFVGPYDFQTDDVQKKFASKVKAMRIQLTGDASTEQNGFSHGNGYHVAGAASLCRYFVNGLCHRGSQCTFSHSLEAKRPVCHFVFSLQGCRNGDSCFFSHDSNSFATSASESSLCCPEEYEDTDAESLLQFFPSSPLDGCILILDDIDLHFSSHFARQYDTSCIVSTTSQKDPPKLETSLVGVRILSGLNHPYQTIMSREGDNVVPWDEVKCALWFPRFVENGEGQKSLVQNFFSYLAVRLLADALHEVQVIVTMNNIRFSQLQVEKLAKESFFFLRESFPFDTSSFGELLDEVNTKKAMVTSKPISYVFDMYPPADIQFGDYEAIRRQLRPRI
ncbi:hypothetical protein BUALT_Bualt02G0234700 [Buddleja alternifolia]|uniref:RNA helicase n=1 Tax=Buddleja alternifolia TaxID=168488 RepID=A0AAV6Y3U3_9LAMI|nr:hypothetical protein BUALT_Bualt02G0234700 [Buddleja alternifolia]